MAGTSSRIRRGHRRILGVIVGAGLWILLGACSGSDDETPPEVAAVVNGVEIPAAEVEELSTRYVESQLPFTQTGLELPRLSMEETRPAVLNFLIRFAFLEAQAQEFGIEVDRSPEALEAALAAADPQDFEQARTSPEDIADAIYAGEVSRQLALELFPTVPVAETEVQALYDSLAERFAAGWTAETEVAFFAEEDAALQLREDTASGLDFVTQARELGALQAASMGTVAHFTALPEPVLDAIEVVEDGGTSEVVDASGGFLVFHVIHHEDTPERTLEDVRDELEEGLADTNRQGLFDEWLSEGLRAADVEVDDFYGEWDPERGRVSAS